MTDSDSLKNDVLNSNYLYTVSQTLEPESCYAYWGCKIPGIALHLFDYSHFSGELWHGVGGK